MRPTSPEMALKRITGMDINFLGHIDGIMYAESSVIITASERRQGYKRKDGIIVNDEVLSFRFIFKPYFKKYIAEHFGSGMLVKIKGIMLPYAKDKAGNVIDGFTLLGQTIDRASYQTTSTRAEKRMIKESQASSTDKPDLDSFNSPDFLL